MSTTWSVDPESWQAASVQIRECSTQLEEGARTPTAVRQEATRILEALAAYSPDDTGYLRSLIRIVQDSADEKLATKLGLIGGEIAERAGSGASLDEHYRGILGS